eukprot:jgi/Chlat1/3750/Chrsp259S03896
MPGRCCMQLVCMLPPLRLQTHCRYHRSRLCRLSARRQTGSAFFTASDQGVSRYAACQVEQQNLEPCLSCELPDGKTWEFESAAECEAFWTAWRHLMPLHNPSAPPPLPHTLLSYPHVRLHLRARDARSMGPEWFKVSDGTTLAEKVAKRMHGALSGHSDRQETSSWCSFVHAQDGLVISKNSMLAAPQLGCPVPMMLIKENCKVTTLCNPKTVTAARRAFGMESCEWLGVSGVLEVSRPEFIVAAGVDERGQWSVRQFMGEQARAFHRALECMSGKMPFDAATPQALPAQVRESLQQLEASSVSSHHHSIRVLSPKFAPRVDSPRCFAAYHEAGHALMGALSPIADIESSGVDCLVQSVWLGTTKIQFLAEIEGWHATVHAMSVWLGGLVSEELMYGRADTYGSSDGCAGFSDDLAQGKLSLLSTRLAVQYTSSSDGSDAWHPPEESLLAVDCKPCVRTLGLPYSGPYDHRVLALIDQAYSVACSKLSQHEDALHLVAGALMDTRHVTHDQIISLCLECDSFAHLVVPQPAEQEAALAVVQ